MLVKRYFATFFQHVKMKNIARLSERFATYPLPFGTAKQQQDDLEAIA